MNVPVEDIIALIRRQDEEAKQRREEAERREREAQLRKLRFTAPMPMESIYRCYCWRIGCQDHHE